MNAFVPVAVRVSGLVTTTSFAPAPPAGVVQVSEVAELNTTGVQVFPPTFTVAPLTNPVPVIVIDVPPTVEPVDGDTEVYVGGAA